MKYQQDFRKLWKSLWASGRRFAEGRLKYNTRGAGRAGGYRAAARSR